MREAEPAQVPGERRASPAAPSYVRQFCFGSLEVDDDSEGRVIPRDESIAVCITGHGLQSRDTLSQHLETSLAIWPSLSVLDEVLANLKSQIA
jgi:hypothetical protein